MAGPFFGGAFFGGGFFAGLPAPVGQIGDEPSWKDWLQERYLKKHARLVREEKKLVVEKSRVETKLKVARKKNLPVEGILNTYWKINQRIEAKQAEIRLLEIKFQMPNFDDDDDDEEILLLNS